MRACLFSYEHRHLVLYHVFSCGSIGLRIRAYGKLSHRESLRISEDDLLYKLPALSLIKIIIAGIIRHPSLAEPQLKIFEQISVYVYVSCVQYAVRSL